MSFNIHDIFKAVLGPVGNEIADLIAEAYKADRDKINADVKAEGAAGIDFLAKTIESIADPVIDKAFHGFGFVLKGFVHTTINKLVNEGTVALNSPTIEADIDKIVANVVAGLRAL
jgi:hypothetical protein